MNSDIQTAGEGCEIVTTINDHLRNKKNRLERELSEVNEAIMALDANPEIARVLSLVSKAAGRL
jgi:hypothetical protein